jgi:hypothetical protein
MSWKRYDTSLLHACACVAVLASRPVIDYAEQKAFDASLPDAEARRALSGAWTLNPVLSDTVPDDDLAQDSLVVTLDAETATFYQRDGSRRVYRLSGKRERHDLGSGPVWTTATWDGRMLRLQIDGDHGIRIEQRFSLEWQTRRLVVTTSPDPRRLPMNRVRLIYDPLIDRTP